MPPPTRIAPSSATAPMSAPVFGRLELEDVPLPLLELPVSLEEPELPDEVEPVPLADPDAPPPPPEEAAVTTTVPFMKGCGVQWNEYVPALEKVCEPLAPLLRTPVSKDPSSAVAEWPLGPLLLQVTLSPAVTVIVLGVNLKSLIVSPPAAWATART